MSNINLQVLKCMCITFKHCYLYLLFILLYIGDSRVVQSVCVCVRVHTYTHIESKKCINLY